MSLPNEDDMSSSSDTQVFIHLHSKERPLFLFYNFGFVVSDPEEGGGF